MSQGAVFLDRDGTVIIERHYLSDPAQVELIPGAGAALRRLRQLGLKLVIVTNQSAIGRGLCDQRQLDAVHARLEQLLADEGVRLDAIYYCPHTPDDGCACRKPAPGLIERAVRELQLDPRRCCVIGDKRCDLEAGRSAGMRTVLVRTGYGAELARESDLAADDIADDLRAAVPVIERWLWPASIDVVILCGGRGERLGALTAHTPKPLLPIGERPFLEHLLRRLQQEGCTRAIVAAHYLAEQFRAFIAAHRAVMPGLELVVEPEPLGTGGALRYAADVVQSETFVALNGDSWLNQPVAPVLEAHRQQGVAVTMVVVRARRVEGSAQDKDAVVIGPQHDIRGFTRAGAADDERWMNAGCYVLERRAVQRWPRGAYVFEARLPSLVTPAQSRVFYSEESLLDIGTPACYAQANEAWPASVAVTEGRVS